MTRKEFCNSFYPGLFIGVRNIRLVGATRRVAPTTNSNIGVNQKAGKNRMFLAQAGKPVPPALGLAKYPLQESPPLLK
jgi:hypothetical protein